MLSDQISASDVIMIVGQTEKTHSIALCNTIRPKRHPSTLLKVKTYSPSFKLSLLISSSCAKTTRSCSISQRRITPGRQPVSARGVTQRGGVPRRKAILRIEVSVSSSDSLNKSTSELEGVGNGGTPMRERAAEYSGRWVVLVRVNMLDGVQQVSRYMSKMGPNFEMTDCVKPEETSY